MAHPETVMKAGRGSGRRQPFNREAGALLGEGNAGELCGAQACHGMADYIVKGMKMRGNNYVAGVGHFCPIVLQQAGELDS